MNQKRGERPPASIEHMSQRDYQVPKRVYRSRITRVILIALQIFGFVSFQAGSQLHTASLFSEAKLDLQLACLWTALTGLSVIYFSLLFWEATRFRFVHRTVGIGLQFIYSGMCGWIGWLMPLPASYTPLSFIVSVPLGFFGIWGTLVFGSFLLLLVWDAKRGASSRRLIDWRQRTSWDGSLHDALLAGTPEKFAEKMLDAWYELRETIKQGARGE